MKQYQLKDLIGQNLYGKVVDGLKQEQRDKGYTDKWLKETIFQFNREWRDMLALAVAENNGEISKRMAQYTTIKNTNFTHNLSKRDIADLQFLQTLIKTRILNECQGQPALIRRILDEYINTQVGARAIMFLANDGDVREDVKPYYTKAAANATSVWEKRFYEEKAEKLDRLDKEIAPFYLNAIIGDAMLKQANERVSQDAEEQAPGYYFDGVYSKPMEEPTTALGQNEDM